MTPGNRAWTNSSLPRPAQSVDRARELLRSAGFRWSQDGILLDSGSRPVEFSIIAASSSPERIRMATLIQDDLKRLGVSVRMVSLEFRAVVDRVLNTHDYEACILGLGGGDGDPNSEVNVWLSSGGSHLWNPGQKQPSTQWEAEIDHLMREQMTTLDHAERKRLYDRVQTILSEQLPLICLASPNILVAAHKDLGNFQPAPLDSYTLWNVEQLYWRSRSERKPRPAL